MNKIKEDIAAMSANISAQTPENVLKVVDPSGQLPIEDRLSEARLKEFLRELLESDDLEDFTVD